MSQLSEVQQKQLEKQQYRLVGSHSAVKVCGWTKSMLRNKGGCYKFKFYGIRSHQCMQMTSSMYCANRCSFCWRGEKAPVSKEWYGDIDNPVDIISGSKDAHLSLLEGFHGNKEVNTKLLDQMKDIKHVALSLTGEPITYSKFNELVDEFHKRGISTFLVTNAQFPEALDNLKTVTQLYVSVDAPNKLILKDVDKPLFPDYYERLQKSLEILSKKKCRTCIRLTVIRGLNDTDLQGYKQLIEKGNPDFIEVKGYMFVGESTKHLVRENMPEHEYVQEFANKILEYLPDYEIVSEHVPSRVLCFIKKSFNKKQYIDFHKYFENPDLDAIEYSSEKMCPN